MNGRFPCGAAIIYWFGSVESMLTIGHSTLHIESFLKILQENRVQMLVDIRTVPKSKHNPQFAQENLAPALAGAGIGYRWYGKLGGLRHAHRGSINTGWRNASFRGYADYMQTADFSAALDDLLKSVPVEYTALMCAEAVPWRCHRSLVGDALTARGVVVEDITYSAQGKSRCAAHQMTPFARVEGERLWYPADDGLFTSGSTQDE